MTPPRAEFLAGLTREQDKRHKERCVKRKAGDRLVYDYTCQIFAKQYRRYDRCKRP